MKEILTVMVIWNVIISFKLIDLWLEHNTVKQLVQALFCWNHKKYNDGANEILENYKEYMENNIDFGGKRNDN